MLTMKLRDLKKISALIWVSLTGLVATGQGQRFSAVSTVQKTTVSSGLTTQAYQLSYPDTAAAHHTAVVQDTGVAQNSVLLEDAMMIRKKVILQGFTMGPYWDGSAWDTVHTWGVPCPADERSFPRTTQWFYDVLASKAKEIAASGFTAVWMPSAPKGSGGYYGHSLRPVHAPGGVYDVGYGIFDDYDLGEKFQQGSVETRYGSRTQLTRCIAMLRANGMDVYHDFVLNQRNGLNMKPMAPPYQVLGYKDAFGNDNSGRFPKYTGDFFSWGRVPGAIHGKDPNVPAEVYPDGTATGAKESLWGPDFAHISGQRNINGTEGVWCATQLKQWGDWLMRATGVQGYRLDNVSGMSWDFIRSFVNYGAMKDKFSVAELVGTYYSNYQLRQWLQESIGKRGSNFTMFDQMLQPLLLAICKTDKYNMAALQSKYLSWNTKDASHTSNAINPEAGSEDPGAFSGYRSLMAIDPEQAVTVVNEVDMETPIGTMPRVALPKECLLGYAYILTIGFGTPCISYKDWSMEEGCYGSTLIGGHTLQTHLNRLIWCNSFVTTGDLRNEQVSANGYVYSYEKTGDHNTNVGNGGSGNGSGAIVFLNSDRENDQEIDVYTDISDNTVLMDYTYHGVSAAVRNGRLSVKVPANRDGRGYLVLAKPGIQGSFQPGRSGVTQEWEGNADLGIRPASGEWQEICRIWVDSNQVIRSRLIDYNTTGWRKGTNLELEILQISAEAGGGVVNPAHASDADVVGTDNITRLSGTNRAPASDLRRSAGQSSSLTLQARVGSKRNGGGTARATESSFQGVEGTKSDDRNPSIRVISRKFDLSQRGDSVHYRTGDAAAWYIFRIRGNGLPKVGSHVRKEMRNGGKKGNRKATNNGASPATRTSQGLPRTSRGLQGLHEPEGGLEKFRAANWWFRLENTYTAPAEGLK